MKLHFAYFNKLSREINSKSPCCENSKGIWQLYGVEQHRKELEHAAQNHEDVEYRVHPPLPGADAVEHRADGIGDAPQEQQQKSRKSEHLQGLPHEGENGPAQADVADHGEHVVFF